MLSEFNNPQRLTEILWGGAGAVVNGDVCPNEKVKDIVYNEMK